MGCKMGAYFRKVYEDHVAQLALRVVGNPDAHDPGIIGGGNILMFRGIDQLLRHA
jgi:hypothetical protein